jgi:hypothetical protein
MRVIIRFSLDNDSRNDLRHAVVRPLINNGITLRDATSTFEGNVSPAALSGALREFWQIAGQENWSPARVDHFWMYVDRSN